MADEDRDTPLPRRVRGATRAGTSTSPPAISEELRHRMQAAVTAERSAAAARVHAGEQQSSAGGEVTTPAVESPVEDASARGAVNGAAALPARITQPERTGQAGRPDGAGSFAEDEVTEWLGTSAGTRPAAKRGSGGAVQPWPATDRPADREPAAPSKARLAVLAAAGLMIGSLAVLAVRHFTGSPGNAQASAAMARQDAEARDQAAAWVVQQVSPSAIVSCDLVMCNALTAYGFPSRDLLVLGPTSPDPVTSA